MIYEKVKNYIRKMDMIREGDLVLAGVSGGADSMAMLDILRRCRTEFSFSLLVVHVEHGIRGEEALRDQRHVEGYCEKWKLPCRSFSFSVPEYAKARGCGVEEAGRLLRDSAFREAASHTGQRTRIALAHNQNDQAETILHNLARGSGLRGMMGILPVSGDKIRPLLCLRRTQIEQYLKEQEVTCVTDSTNLQDHYTRNRIRHHILPLMEQEVNASAVAHMAETASWASQAEAYLTGLGMQLVKQYQEEFSGGKTVHFTEAFFSQEPIIRSYAVREALYLLGGFRKDLTSYHIRSVLELEEKQVNRQVSLPYGLCAVRTYQGIRIQKQGDFPGKDDTSVSVTAPVSTQKRADRKASEASGTKHPLFVPGRTEGDFGSFFTRIFPYQGEKIEENRYTKWLDYDKIHHSLSVRTRKTGDFLAINAQGNRKKLNRCMIDDKIPLEERDRIPLVASGSEILWIVGGRMSEAYKITSGTGLVLEIIYEGGRTE